MGFQRDPSAYYKYEPYQCYRTHELYIYRSMTGDRTVHNYRPDTVMIDKSIQEAILIM